MKSIEVFEGNQLYQVPLQSDYSGETKCVLHGKKSDGQDVYMPLSEEILGRHVMVLGGIGTGKTNAFFQIMNQLTQTMNDEDIMIIFDTKGDFYKEYYQPGDIVISNDATCMGEEGKDYWNLFNEIERDEHMEENIIEISNMLFHNKIEKSSQPFFPNAAKDIFAGVLTYICKDGDKNKESNLALKEFFNVTSTNQLKEIFETDADLRSLISYIQDAESPQTQGIMSELTQTIREIFLGNFKKDGTLSIRKLIREKRGKKIFIEYDMGIGNMLCPIYSLMYDLAIKEALCRKKSEGNVYFITDEFSLIPNLKHIDDAVNFGRSLGVKFMVGIQNVSQLYEIYGESRARSIMSGFLTTIVFRVNDEVSRKFVQELHGANRKKEVYMASVQGRGIVENVRDANVVEDWDILYLKRGDAIIGLPELPPFIFHFTKAE